MRNGTIVVNGNTSQSVLRDTLTKRRLFPFQNKKICLFYNWYTIRRSYQLSADLSAAYITLSNDDIFVKYCNSSFNMRIDSTMYEILQSIAIYHLKTPCFTSSFANIDKDEMVYVVKYGRDAYRVTEEIQ